MKIQKSWQVLYRIWTLQSPLFTLHSPLSKKAFCPLSGTEGIRGATQLARAWSRAARLRCKGRAPAIPHRPLRDGSRRRPSASHRPGSSLHGLAPPFPFVAVWQYDSTIQGKMQEQNGGVAESGECRVKSGDLVRYIERGGLEVRSRCRNSSLEGRGQMRYT